MRGGPTSGGAGRSRVRTRRSWKITFVSRSLPSATGGLSADEAFLVAVKRMGAIDALTREFAREHSDRLWKQLVLSGDGGTEAQSRPGPTALGRCGVALALAAAAGVAIKLPAFFGMDFDKAGPRC